MINLGLKTGIVPKIWCKGLITPVHKNGNSLNTDQYVPSAVLGNS